TSVIRQAFRYRLCNLYCPSVSDITIPPHLRTPPTDPASHEMNSNRGYQSHRGGRGGRGGGGHGRGGNDQRGGQQGGQGSTAERKPPILDLAQYMDKGVNVKLMGGREGRL